MHDINCLAFQHICVILCEFLSGRLAFTFLSMIEEVFQSVRGELPYPWEWPALELPEGWKQSKACSYFQACLSREPAAWSSAKQLCSIACAS
jgi:hypothetical protein